VLCAVEDTEVAAREAHRRQHVETGSAAACGVRMLGSSS
jgi:hypothetical protein